MQASNDKQRKRHKLAEDFESCGKRSVASKVDRESNGTAVPSRDTPDGKLGEYHRLSGYSEQSTNRILTDTEAEDATGLHVLHDNQSSGKKSDPKNHNQTRSILKFKGQINETYKAFLSGLCDKDGHPVFQSGGKVVTYEKDPTSESDSDSDLVIIMGDRVNGVSDCKYYSTMPKKYRLQDLEFNKSRTSKDSSFKKKLMKNLLKPYNQIEYESLMEMAGKRKPLEGYRDMCRGPGERKGTNELESLGKSYLDHHKDVAEAIRNVEATARKF